MKLREPQPLLTEKELSMVNLLHADRESVDENMPTNVSAFVTFQLSGWLKLVAP